MTTGLLIALVLMSPFIFCIAIVIITMICAPFIILAKAFSRKYKNKQKLNMVFEISKDVNKEKYNYCFGIMEVKNLEVPEGVIKYKIKMSNSNYAKIFLKYSDKIEECYLEKNGYGKFRCDTRILTVNKREVKK